MSGVTDQAHLGAATPALTAAQAELAVQARQAPDVSLLSDVWWFRFYLANALAPLDDLIAANEVDTADYVDSLYNEGVRDGTSFWLPFARSTPLFYYNADAFAEVGLEEAPEFWQDLVDVAPELVQRDGDTITRAAFSHPTGASYIAWLFQAVIWQFEGAYSDPEFNILINEPNGVEAGEFYRSSTMDGWATLPADNEADFANGLTASVMASTGSLRGITQNVGDKFDFRTAFLPKAKQFGCLRKGQLLVIEPHQPSPGLRRDCSSRRDGGAACEEDIESSLFVISASRFGAGRKKNRLPRLIRCR